MNHARTIHFPGRYDLQEQPQRGPLAALNLALSLAESALLNAHAKSGYQPTPTDHPPVELARVVIARSAELRGLIPAYLAILNAHPNDTDDDIPF